MFLSIITTYKNAYSGLSRQTWLLSGVILVNRAGYMAVPFMSLYATQSLHRSTADAGLLITLFGIGSIFGALAGGKLTDVIGFRPVQITAAISGGLLFLCFAHINHFHTLCVLAVIISFFSEAFRPANFTAIASYAKPDTITRAYSLNRLATNIGWSFGVSMGGIIASYQYKLLFWVDGLVGIAAGVAIFLLLPNLKTQTVKTETPKANLQNLNPPWRDGVYLRFLLLVTLFTTCFFVMFRVVPLFFKSNWHIKEFEIGLILGLNGIIIALFEMVMINRIEKRRPPMFYIVLGTGVVAMAYAVLSVPGGFYTALAVLCLVLFTLGEMLALPFINAFVVTRSHIHNRGQYAAAYTLSWSVAQIIGPMAGLSVAEKWGYNWLWAGMALLLLLCALGFSYLSKYSTTKEKATQKPLPQEALSNS